MNHLEIVTTINQALFLLSIAVLILTYGLGMLNIYMKKTYLDSIGKANKYKKLFVLVILFILIAILAGILVYKPFRPENQHPMPWLIGTLKKPEYREGGCIDFKRADWVTSSIAMKSPPFVSNSIFLKNIEDDSEFWTEVKETLLDNEKWIIDSYSVTLEGYSMYISIDQADWNAIDAMTKHDMLSSTIKLLKKETAKASLYI